MIILSTNFCLPTSVFIIFEFHSQGYHIEGYDANPRIRWLRNQLLFHAIMATFTRPHAKNRSSACPLDFAQMGQVS